jgi:hypothetical protein
MEEEKQPFGGVGRKFQKKFLEGMVLKWNNFPTFGPFLEVESGNRDLYPRSAWKKVKVWRNCASILRSYFSG